MRTALLAAAGLTLLASSLASPLITSNAAGAVPSASIDHKRLAAAIRADLLRLLPNGVNVSVSCPAGVPIAVGTKSKCTAQVGDQTLVYRVSQEGALGHMRFRQTRAIMRLDRTERAMATQLAAKLGGKWQVRCLPDDPDRVYLMAVGKSFKCQASGRDGDGLRHQMAKKVTVRDFAGNVNWS